MRLVVPRATTFLLLAFGGCLEPTQVKLTLTTDICNLKRVTIYFDGQPDTPIASFDPKGLCPRDLGSLVFVPSGKKDAKFGIVVEATKAADGKCDPMQCAKASRTVAYVEHAALELPIALEASCVGVSCSPSETCFKGRCVDRDTVCAIAKTCDFKDASSVADVALDVIQPATDAGPGFDCTRGASGMIVPGTLLHHWSFDEMVGPYGDSAGMSPVMLAVGFTQVPGRCGLGVGYPMGTAPTMSLGTAVATKGAGFVADLRVPSTTAGPFAILSAAPMAAMGWRISGVGDGVGSYTLFFAVTASGQNTATVGAKTKIPADGQWHRVEVIGWGSVIHFWADTFAMPESVAVSSPIPTGMLPLQLTGSPTPIAIDSLFIYSGQ